jgi:hypothetical protein
VSPDLWAIVPIAGMGLSAFFMFGVYKLLSRWLDAKARRDAAPPSEDVRELQREVDELRALPERVAQLEERLDFAERLLARERERASLRPGS